MITVLPVLAQWPLIVRYTTWMIVPGVAQVGIESRSHGAVHSDDTYRDQPTHSIISLNRDIPIEPGPKEHGESRGGAAHRVACRGVTL